MKKLLPFAVAAVLAALAVTFWPRPATTELTAFGAAAAQDSEEVDTSLVREMVLGDENAPVTIIEYASATCPHCRSFHMGTLPQVKAEYIDTGKVKFIYREVYFDRFGLWAGMVARCGIPTGEDADPAEVAAGDKRYFALMNVIFEQQPDWTKGDSPAAIAENLSKIGRTAGLGADQVDACMQDAALARAMVAVWQQNQQADDVKSTPTFIINGETVTGARGFEEFSGFIEEHLDN